MSRRAPIPDLYHQRGDVYILHLDPPYKHAAHYSGFSPENSEGVQARIADHAAGRGAAARLMQVQHDAGGTFRIGRLWRGVTREREVRVKESSAAKYCLICRGQPGVDLDLPPEPGARWIANEPEPGPPWGPSDPHITPELLSVVDRLTAGWAAQKAADLEIEAGA
jgi:hypothetical protein